MSMSAVLHKLLFINFASQIIRIPLCKRNQILHKYNERQMGGVKNVKKPSANLNAGVGGPKYQRGRQQGENRPVHRMAADYKSQRVAGTAPHGRQIAQTVESSPQRRLIAAEVENHHEDDACEGIIKVPDAQRRQ